MYDHTVQKGIVQERDRWETGSERKREGERGGWIWGLMTPVSVRTFGVMYDHTVQNMV